MTDITGNVWASELNSDGNVWANNTVGTTLNNGSSVVQMNQPKTNNASDRSNEENEEMTTKSSIEFQAPVTIRSRSDQTAPVDEELIWRDIPTEETKADTILDNDNIWKDVIGKGENVIDEGNEKKEDDTKQVTQLESGIQNSIIPAKEEPEEPEEQSKDDFDDFGEFEEIPTKLLTFDKPLKELLEAIFPGMDKVETHNQNATQREKSTLLVNGGVKPMKCYNTIIASNRQCFADTIPILNTRQRGCIEKMQLHNDVLGIVNKWIYDEKGINTDSEKNISLSSSNKQSWRNIGRHGIFRWSSKAETDDESNREADKAEYNLNERTIIGQKLLNASFEQARRIIEERLEEQKERKLALEKAKWEREQILKKDLLKKEEEMAKYTVESVDVKNEKKKGFFGKMFATKSKIAKDHISHKKIVQSDDNGGDVGDISLKEQLEREGYNLTNGKNKKKKQKHGGKSSKGDAGDDEDYYDDDDSDDDGFGEMVGYNVLDPNVDIEAPTLPITDTVEFENTIPPKTYIVSEERNNTGIQIENQIENVNMTPDALDQSSGENTDNNNDSDYAQHENNDNDDDDSFGNFHLSEVSRTQEFSNEPTTERNQSVGNLIDL